MAAVRGVTIPGIVWFFIWVLAIIVVLFIIGVIAHAFGGGFLHLHLGHFEFRIGFT